VPVGKESVTVVNHVTSLSGAQLAPLSHCYAMPIIVRNNTYPSVEHYVYTRLLRALRLPPAYVLRLRTVVRPCDVWRSTLRLIAEARRLRDVPEWPTHQWQRIMNQVWLSVHTHTRFFCSCRNGINAQWSANWSCIHCSNVCFCVLDMHCSLTRTRPADLTNDRCNTYCASHT
jgi:hypothetical protein